MHGFRFLSALLFATFAIFPAQAVDISSAGHPLPTITSGRAFHTVPDGRDTLLLTAMFAAGGNFFSRGVTAKETGVANLHNESFAVPLSRYAHEYTQLLMTTHSHNEQDLRWIFNHVDELTGGSYYTEDVVLENYTSYLAGFSYGKASADLGCLWELNTKADIELISSPFNKGYDHARTTLRLYDLVPCYETDIGMFPEDFVEKAGVWYDYYILAKFLRS